MEANYTPKGRAKYIYNRVINAMAEDNQAAMCHTFAALTQQAKSVVLQSGKFSNTYILGSSKGMPVDEAAKELTAKAAALVSCKPRKIDLIITEMFLAEYISRQRKENEPKPSTTETANTMNTTTTDTAAPEFSELSHAATNIVLTANNTYSIYASRIEPFIGSLTKKVAKGVTLDASNLVASSVMAVIISESVKEMKRAGWIGGVTPDDRKQAAAYLAGVYISDAIESV